MSLNYNKVILIKKFMIFNFLKEEIAQDTKTDLLFLGFKFY